MRTRALGSGAVVCAVLLAATQATAQGFGLDLTDSPDLRPSLALIGVAAPPEHREDAAAAAALLERLAKSNNRFVRVITPGEVEVLLGDEYAAALACTEPSCLTALSHLLAVNRILKAEWSDAGLELRGFDWGSQEQHSATLDPGLLRPGRSAEKKAAAAVDPVLEELAALVGTLEVVTNAADAEIRWGDKLLGTGEQVKTVVSGGTHPLNVTAPGHEPVTRTVTVPPGGVAREEVVFGAASASAAQVVETEFDAAQRPPVAAQPLWERPGAWVAAAGVATLLTGLGFGASASAVGGRMTDRDGDGALDVTRAEALGAQRSAVMANVLSAAGLLMIGGGGAWLYLGSDGVAGSGGGVMVHGSF